MNNKTSFNLDTLKMSENKKITKQLDEGGNTTIILEVIYMSGKVIKINHVGKRQERVLLVTNRNLFNVASTRSILPNRIKRRIPFQ